MRRFASVVLVDDRGWVLLQERDEHAGIDPERWGFAGGHVEDDEHPDDAAYRELEEETGVRLDDGLAPAGVFHVDHHGDGRTQEVHAFAARISLTDDEVECHEGRQMVFVDPARLPRLDLGAGAAAILPVVLPALGAPTSLR